MGHRLSKIVTRTGDDGTTGLGDGSRVEKNSLRIEAIGTIDELNSLIGLLISYSLPEDISQTLSNIQHDLFDLGGEISVPDRETVTSDYISRLENELTKLNEDLPALKEFILPGGTQAAACCHVTRTVCRRAERRLVSLIQVEPVSEHAVSYLNRLSDLLFVLARHLNFSQNEPDILWQPGRNQNKNPEQ